MKKVRLLALFVLLCFGFAATSEAALVASFGTADNHFWAWNGASWDFIGNINPDTSTVWDWGTAEAFNCPSTQPYLYFAVANAYNPNGAPASNQSPNNPAGFLAQLRTKDHSTFASTGTDTLLTNTASWEIVSFGNGWNTDPMIDPTLLSGWSTPVSYGTNGVAPWGEISPIDSNAQWLWTARNSGEYANMDNYCILRTQASAVPEPATMSLLGLGLAGVGLLRRKK